MKVHICISGATQSYRRWHGIIDLAEQLRIAGHARSSQSRIYYFPWRSDWRAIAEHLALLSERYRRMPAIAIYGYSWGGGWGAPRLARELSGRGLEVRNLVLSDPVYCHPFWTLRWRAMTNWDLPIIGEPVIRIPDNVAEVDCFFQRQNRPSGHRLLAENGHTKIHPRIELSSEHQYMDSAPEFHLRALEVAAEL